MKTNDNSSANDDLMKAGEAARLLGVSPRTLARWSEDGFLPPAVRLGPGERRYYYRKDIDALPIKSRCVLEVA